MKHWKTNTLGLFVSFLALLKILNIVHLTVEQEKTISDFVTALLCFIAADGATVTKSLLEKLFQNLGKR